MIRIVIASGPLVRVRATVAHPDHYTVSRSKFRMQIRLITPEGGRLVHLLSPCGRRDGKLGDGGDRGWRVSTENAELMKSPTI